MVGRIKRILRENLLGLLLQTLDILKDMSMGPEDGRNRLIPLHNVGQ